MSETTELRVMHIAYPESADFVIVKTFWKGNNAKLTVPRDKHGRGPDLGIRRFIGVVELEDGTLEAAGWL